MARNGRGGLLWRRGRGQAKNGSQKARSGRSKKALKQRDFGHVFSRVAKSAQKAA